MSNIVQRVGRLLYIEPNDVFDRSLSRDEIQVISDAPITPKYEDMCISFKLMIDKFSRLRKSGQSGTDSSGHFSIQWQSTMESLLKQRESISTLEGELKGSNDKENFLTTYFTDITFESYNKKTQIEGLGVESIQVSYESWYTPTVIIKFVDVRGSAIFGREEANHVDETMTVDNIFGAFFTYPFPRFRLQIKGFYGRPVTYQLTCSGFKGSLNANTGNFEVVATFIGYSWSLLTEIPFMYLVAAPNATYKGVDYWNEHVNTADWQLWDETGENTPPPKLDELFTNIRSSVDIINEDIEQKSREESDKVSNLNKESDLMQTILSERQKFINKLNEDIGIGINDNGKSITKSEPEGQQMILFSKTETVELTEEAKKIYKAFYDKLEEYTNTFKGDISTDKSPNKWKDKIPDKLTFKKIFNIETDDNEKIKDIKFASSENISDDISKLKELPFNDNLKLTDSSANTLMKAYNEKYEFLKEYAYIIDLYDLNDLVDTRTSAIDVDNQKIIDNINNGIQETIVKLIGFKPYIGNVFKIFFCHLETFCHILFSCADEIQKQASEGYRSRSYLGISEAQDGFGGTDFLAKDGDFKDNVGPWPAIYNDSINKSTQGISETGYKSDISNVYGWPGDFQLHRFLEEKVVYSLQEGIEHMVDKIDSINNNSNTTNQPSNYLNFPILPSDFSKNGNVFNETNEDSVSDLAGHLAIRAAGIFGITYPTMSETLAQTIGKLDACNYFMSVGSTNGLSRITNVLKDKSDNYNVFTDIVTCNDNGDKYATNKVGETGTTVYHNFETARLKSVVQNGKKIDRHPMFIDNGGSYDVNHWYDAKGIEYVPTSLKKEFNKYDADLKATHEGGSYKVIPSFYNDGVQSYDWIYKCNCDRINGVGSLYTNKQMFDIFTDSKSVEKIVNKATEMKAGGVKAVNYEIKDDLNDFVNTFIKADNAYKSRYFDSMADMFSTKLTTLGLKTEIPNTPSTLTQSQNEDNKIYITTLFDRLVKINETSTDSKKRLIPHNEQIKILGNGCIAVDNECNFKNQGKTINFDECCVQQIKCFKKRKNGDIIKLCFFGSQFFYLQNVISNPKQKLYAKAILFLHCFKYDYNKIINVFAKDKKNGCVEIVPKAYLLLLGGLLWRKKQSSDIFAWEYPSPKYYFKKVNKNDTFFIKHQESKIAFLIPSTTDKPTDKDAYENRIHVSELFGGREHIDKNIENRLINLFTTFAEGDFSSILDSLEMKYYDKKLDRETEMSLFNLNVMRGLLLCKEATLKYFDYDIDIIKKISDTALSNKYESISINDTGEFTMVMNESNSVQDKIKDLYFNSYAVYDACHRVLGVNPNDTSNDKITVNKNLWDNYIKGFYNTIDEISKEENVSIGGVVNMNVSDTTNRNRDLSISIYYYIKNLWDKWLLPSKDDYFDVRMDYKDHKEGFFNNFIFIDSFYRNVYNKLAINCQCLLDAFTNLQDNASLFSFIGRIITDHKCILLPVPDFIGFNNDSLETNERVLEDLFRPMPYNSMPSASNSNKFVVIYTHNPASHASEDNYYKTDGYDIWSHSGTIKKTHWTPEAEALFKEDKKDENRVTNTIATRFGYYVPSFGIAFGRQQNHLFKNMNISMDNPVMTEQAILAQWQIAMKGSTSGRSICFTGQDTFNVFSNYSYNIDVEMMGNAQICPLMYFQFLNVPMWRGTYMIYKVSHEMTAGNMITRFSGMKMSKFAKPFNTDFFTIVKTIKIDTPTYHLNSDCNDGSENTSPFVSNYGKPGMFTGKSNEEKMEMLKAGHGKNIQEFEYYSNKTNKKEKIKLNKYLIHDFLAIVEEIEKEIPWYKFYVGERGHYRANSNTNHGRGLAVDINPGQAGNPWFNLSGKNIPKTEKEVEGKTAIEIGKNHQSDSWPGNQFKYDRTVCIWSCDHPVIKIFEKHGWGWGGTVIGGDVMHFSINGH